MPLQIYISNYSEALDSLNSQKALSLAPTSKITKSK